MTLNRDAMAGRDASMPRTALAGPYGWEGPGPNSGRKASAQIM